MSITAVEKYAGRRPADGDRPSNEIPYLVFGTAGEDDEEDMRAALRATAPVTLTNAEGQVLALTSCKITDRLFNGWYEGTATYGSADENKQTGESEFSFDTTGGTVKITQSKYQTGFPLGQAADLQRAIGVTDDSVEGVEIIVPQYAWSETHYIAADDVNDTYKGTLYALTGRTNNAGFKGTSLLETLFLGARGGKRGRGDWQITFNFLSSPNITGLTIGDISDIDKYGHEYLWVRYVKKKVGEGENAVLGMKPLAVYCERVYDSGDLSLLGIGV